MHPSPDVCVTVADGASHGIRSDEEVDAYVVSSPRFVNKAIALFVKPCIGRTKSAGENVTPEGNPCLVAS